MQQRRRLAVTQRSMCVDNHLQTPRLDCSSEEGEKLTRVEGRIEFKNITYFEALSCARD